MKGDYIPTSASVGETKFDLTLIIVRGKRQVAVLKFIKEKIFIEKKVF